MSSEPFNRVLIITIGHERKNLLALTSSLRTLGGLWVDEDGEYVEGSRTRGYNSGGYKNIQFRFTVGQLGHNSQWLVTVLPTGSGRPDVEIKHANTFERIKSILFTSITYANWVEAVFGGEEYCDGITDSSQRWHTLRRDGVQALGDLSSRKDRKGE